MCLDPYVQSIVIRSRIAELHRQAAQRQLIREARPSTPRPRRRSIIPTLVRAFAIAWR